MCKHENHGRLYANARTTVKVAKSKISEDEVFWLLDELNGRSDFSISAILRDEENFILTIRHHASQNPAAAFRYHLNKLRKETAA